MSRYIDADALKANCDIMVGNTTIGRRDYVMFHEIDSAPSIDIVRCSECKKSHIDGKTTHYLWCTEWGRSTDAFGYCERGEREGE